MLSLSLGLKYASAQSCKNLLNMKRIVAMQIPFREKTKQREKKKKPGFCCGKTNDFASDCVYFLVPHYPGSKVYTERKTISCKRSLYYDNYSMRAQISSALIQFFHVQELKIKRRRWITEGFEQTEDYMNQRVISQRQYCSISISVLSHSALTSSFLF